MVSYQNSLEGISEASLEGFFVGWPTKPSPETHFRLLQKSDFIVLAVEDNKVVGFITAISDGVLVAYIPFLEVLPSHQKQGIGMELLKKMLEMLKEFYMIDLLCDENLQGFYEKLGMDKAVGMRIRNYTKQQGIDE